MSTGHQPSIAQRLAEHGAGYAAAYAELCSVISDCSFGDLDEESGDQLVAVFPDVGPHETAGEHEAAEFSVQMEIRSRPPELDGEMLIEHREDSSSLPAAVEKAAAVLRRFPGATGSATVERVLLQIHGSTGHIHDELSDWMAEANRARNLSPGTGP